MSQSMVIQECLDAHNADALLVSFLPDIRWLTKFSGSSALVVCTSGNTHFLTDGRYIAQSAQEITEAEVHIASTGLIQCVQEKGLLQAARRIVVQAEHITLAQLEHYKELFPDIQWIPVSQIFDKSVAVKNSEEKEAIQLSQSVTDSVFEYLMGVVRPGMTEQEIAAEIVYQHLSRGAVRMSFDPIVASGPNSALPHARPTSRKLQAGDMVVVDMGCFVDGYASDMTRTFAIGDPGQEALDVYKTVLDAQMIALDKASPLLTTKELDQLARSVIEDAGYGNFFVHSLGHGVGLQIHEWPSISWRSEYPLMPGMVITIEPGVYIPGKMGVRIEDMIQLTQEGCVNLTTSPKELITL